jgi:hypothetical protein
LGKAFGKGFGKSCESNQKKEVNILEMLDQAAFVTDAE